MDGKSKSSKFVSSDKMIVGEQDVRMLLKTIHMVIPIDGVPNVKVLSQSEESKYGVRFSIPQIGFPQSIASLPVPPEVASELSIPFPIPSVGMFPNQTDRAFLVEFKDVKFLVRIRNGLVQMPSNDGRMGDHTQYKPDVYFVEVVKDERTNSGGE